MHDLLERLAAAKMVSAGEAARKESSIEVFCRQVGDEGVSGELETVRQLHLLLVHDRSHSDLQLSTVKDVSEARKLDVLRAVGDGNENVLGHIPV